MVIFDLDGTLLDSDSALVEPFVLLGIPHDAISFGHPIEAECQRLGIELDAYIDAYDTTAAVPFPGVEDLLATLPTWGLCSNKARPSATAELTRLGWRPAVAMFADDFLGEAKRLGPVLERMRVAGSDVLFVGDSEHDEVCAEDVGASFAWAGWNPRTAATDPSGVVLRTPADVLVAAGVD